MKRFIEAVLKIIIGMGYCVLIGAALGLFVGSASYVIGLFVRA